MARPWFRRGRSTEEGEHVVHALSAQEAAAVRQQRAVPASQGYPADIPMGGTTKQNAGYQGSTDRRAFLDELYGAYLACPWSSASVDVIAKTVTAGGLEIAPDADVNNPEQVPDPTAEVAAAQKLLDFVNPREDSRQLARGGIQDLGIFGDAFYELVWFAGSVVAVYSLDAPSMIPLADEHGTVMGYSQVLDPQRTVDFDEHEVIHISLDAPRGGLYGVSPTQKNLIPITSWLFAAGLLKETMRKGNPRPMHIDHPLTIDKTEIERQRQQYMVRNLGIANIGSPLMTSGGANVTENGQNQIKEYLETLAGQRDTILSGYGVPPSKVGVIESGNLGGGTGTSQDKTFRVNTCGPVAETFLEKLTFHLLMQAFGITGWRAAFGDVDWRDDKVVEDIRDTRIRNATWTINRARAEVGEPPVPGGDSPVLVDRQNMVLVADLPAYSTATVKALEAKGTPAPAVPADAAAGVVVPVPDAKAKESISEVSAGVMVALVPPAEVAASLAVEGGLPVEELHVTLAYLGQDIDDPEALATLVQAWALATPPLECSISGIGVFAPTVGSDGLPVTYASVDCADLPAARQRLVDLLTASGQPVATTHGFTPHMTLAYDEVEGDVASVVTSWTSESVVLFVGGERTAFPLSGTPQTAAEADMAATWARTYAVRRAQAVAELV
jgi:2'-5' RNA ligase